MIAEANSKERQKIFGLDTLRFFAFFSVFICHATPYWPMGNMGIDFFFVLSSFLLTNLSFNEISKTGSFSRKNFFIRRCLRIYPLYYLVILFSFFALPALAGLLNTDVSLPEKKYMYFLFLSNFDRSDHFFPLKFLWSIAVEEQFYVLFLLLSLFFKRGFNILIIALFISFIAGTLAGMKYNWLLYTHPVFYLAHFASGMLAARLYFKGIDLSTKTLIGLVLLFLLITILFFNIPLIGPFRNIPLSLLFASLIVTVITAYQRKLLRPNLFLSITENLGKYTYGLYVYSGFILVFVSMLLPAVNIFLRVVIELTILIIIAWLSFHLFEKKFLKLKNFFRHDRKDFTARGTK